MIKETEVSEEIKNRGIGIKNALSKGIWTVEFQKVDGTDSVMECTLDPKYLPNDPNKIEGIPDVGRKQSDHLIHVYSVDREGWRSFYASKVKSIEPNLSFHEA